MVIIGDYDYDYYDCYTSSGWWFQTFLLFHNLWDNPSHWRSYFSRCLKPPTRLIILTSIQGMITIHEGNPGTAICPTRTLGVFADATPIVSAGQIQLWGDVWCVVFDESSPQKAGMFLLLHLLSSVCLTFEDLGFTLGALFYFDLPFLTTVFGGATPCAVPRAPRFLLSLDARGSHQDPSSIGRWKQGGYSAKSDMCPPVNQLHQRCRSFRNGKAWISIACCMFTGW